MSRVVRGNGCKRLLRVTDRKMFLGKWTQNFPGQLQQGVCGGGGQRVHESPRTISAKNSLEQ